MNLNIEYIYILIKEIIYNQSKINANQSGYSIFLFNDLILIYLIFYVGHDSNENSFLF